MNLTCKTRKIDSAKSGSNLRCSICGASLKDVVVVDVSTENLFALEDGMIENTLAGSILGISLHDKTYATK